MWVDAHTRKTLFKNWKKKKTYDQIIKCHSHDKNGHHYNHGIYVHSPQSDGSSGKRGGEKWGQNHTLAAGNKREEWM